MADPAPTRTAVAPLFGESGTPHGALDADIIIANAPDPVFVSDLEGKILEANDAVSHLLGFRRDEVLDQSLSRFISPQETRDFLAALREVLERGVTCNARLNPRSASGEVIPTTLNASALRDPEGGVIGAIGILHDMRAYERVVRDLQQVVRARDRALADAAAERDRLQQVVDVLPIGILIVDASGQLVISNTAAAEIMGLEISGQPPVVPDDKAPEAYGIRRLDGSPYPAQELPLRRALLRGEVVCGEQLLIRNVRDGRAIPVLINSAPQCAAHATAPGPYPRRRTPSGEANGHRCGDHEYDGVDR